MPKVKHLFGNDIFQRCCYASALVVWSIGNLSRNDLQSLQYKSSVGLTYFWLYLIPAIILAIQVIRNNLVLWIIIAGSFLAFTLYALLLTAYDVFNRIGDQIKPFPFSSGSMIILLFGTLLLLNILLWQSKPGRVF
jgi:hypothetical protein